MVNFRKVARIAIVASFALVAVSAESDPDADPRSLATSYPKIRNSRCNRRSRNSCLIGKRPTYCMYDATIRRRRDRCYNKLDYSSDPDATKVLFVGNSFTFMNHMPKAIFHNIAISRGHDNIVVEDTGTQPAATLGYHRYSAKTKQGFDAQEAYTHVVLQEQSMFLSWENPSFRWMQSYQFADDIYAKVKNKGAVPVLYQTWGYYNGIEFQDTYEKMQDRLVIGYKGLQDVMKDLAGSTPPIAPVGQAWRQAHADYGLAMYTSDAKHPSAKGSYLAALTIYCTIFDENPNHSSTYYPRGVSKSEARKFQGMAWEACKAQKILDQET